MGTTLHRTVAVALVPSVLACLACLACHNQSTDDDRGQASYGKAPDSIAIPPQPVVANQTPPGSSVAAADLARTVPPGPPNHDGPAVCHAAIGNLLSAGRQVETQNTGNVAIRACTAVVYVYDRSHAQVARVDVSLFGGDAGAATTLPPRAGVRSLLPVLPAIANDPDAWFVPIVVHVDFADGATWDAPPGRAPIRRPFGEGARRDAVN
jgi:hypothetical protein